MPAADASIVKDMSAPSSSKYSSSSNASRAPAQQRPRQLQQDDSASDEPYTSRPSVPVQQQLRQSQAQQDYSFTQRGSRSYGQQQPRQSQRDYASTPRAPGQYVQQPLTQPLQNYPPQPTAYSYDQQYSTSSRPKSQQKIGPPYVRTRFLFFYFEVDKKYFKPDLEKLQDLFLSCKFEGGLASIPTGKGDASNVVETHLDRFKQFSIPADNELLIIAYGGHGECVPRKEVKSDHRTLHWTATNKQYVKWNELQERVLFPGNKDTLVILDCCYAGAAERSVPDACKDILAACRWDQKTPIIQSERSFTSKMVQAIGKFSASFTVPELVSQVRRELASEPPYYIPTPPDADHKIKLNPPVKNAPPMTVTIRQSGPAGPSRQQMVRQAESVDSTATTSRAASIPVRSIYESGRPQRQETDRHTNDTRTNASVSQSSTVTDQAQRVLAAVAQRRPRNRDHAQAIIKKCLELGCPPELVRRLPGIWSRLEKQEESDDEDDDEESHGDSDEEESE